MPDATRRLIVPFTSARRARKTAALKFYEPAKGPNRQGVDTVPTLQAWISQTPSNLDVVTPIKERACDALLAVLRSRSRRADASLPLMPRGAERC